MKLAIYARVSKTAGDPTSIKEQERRCRAWAREKGHRVVEVYRDDGISGTRLDRPELGRLLHDASAGAFEGVLVYDLDRLARDLVVQETVIGALTGDDVELYSVNQPNLEGDDPWRVFARQIFGASAQLHKAITVVRLRGGRDAAKRRRGHCEGQPRYGYSRRGGKVKPDRQEQEAVAIMKRSKGRGMSYREIAGELASRGIQPRRGRAWHPDTVRRILERGNKPF